MREKLTLKKIIEVVKLSLYFIQVWPLPKDVNKLKVVGVVFYHYLSIILHTCLIVGEINTIKKNFHDSLTIVKAIIIVCADLHVMCNLISYRITSQRLQLVISELQNFCKLIKSNEEAICQKYIERCYIFYGYCIMNVYLITIYVIVGPWTITLDEPFPTNAEYPFDMYRQPMRSIIYLYESICGLQVAAHVCFNVCIALLLWFTSAKFDILNEKLHAVTNIYDLMKCVQEHQKLLNYAKDVIYVVRPFAFISVACSTNSLIVCGLIFITGQPLSMKIQCIGLAFSAVTEVYMYTWPAENLIHTSNEVGETIYNTEWYGQSLELRRSLRIVLMRAQKPIVISIPCLMPILSLNYFASYLSTVLSYFTTLRVFLQTENVN